MARFFFALAPVRLFSVGGFLGFAALVSTSLQAAPPATAPTNAPPANPGAPMAGVPAAAPNKMMPGAPAVPPEDPFNRYGKILAPGTEPAHPLKLALPFPDVGEIKVPTQDELTMREKLEQLATLSDADIRTKLDQWPPFKTMSLKDEGMMLARIQDFRDRRSKFAADAARALGLTLTPAQQARFEKEYWQKRLPMERELAKQFEPILRDRQAKLQEQLFREFSTPGNPLAQAPKPPALPPAKAPPPAAPVTQNKPASVPIAGAPAKPAPAPEAPPSTASTQPKTMD